MIIWGLGCFFVEGKGERTVDAHLKKNLLVFLIGFQIFLKCSVSEIKNKFGIKNFFSSFLFLRIVRQILLTLAGGFW